MWYGRRFLVSLETHSEHTEVIDKRLLTNHTSKMSKLAN